MPMHLKSSGKVVRETYASFRGRPLIIELSVDGVHIWPKGTRQYAKIDPQAAYECALKHNAPALKAGGIGLTKRKEYKHADLLEFVAKIARMTIEGEIIEGDLYVPDGSDTEVDALYALIREARDLTGDTPDGLDKDAYYAPDAQYEVPDGDGQERGSV